MYCNFPFLNIVKAGGSEYVDWFIHLLEYSRISPQTVRFMLRLTTLPRRHSEASPQAPLPGCGLRGRRLDTGSRRRSAPSRWRGWNHRAQSCMRLDQPTLTTLLRVPTLSTNVLACLSRTLYGPGACRPRLQKREAPVSLNGVTC